MNENVTNQSLNKQNAYHTKIRTGEFSRSSKREVGVILSYFFLFMLLVDV